MIHPGHSPSTEPVTYMAPAVLTDYLWDTPEFEGVALDIRAGEVQTRIFVFRLCCGRFFLVDAQRRPDGRWRHRHRFFDCRRSVDGAVGRVLAGTAKRVQHSFERGVGVVGLPVSEDALPDVPTRDRFIELASQIGVSMRLRTRDSEYQDGVVPIPGGRYFQYGELLVRWDGQRAEDVGARFATHDRDQAWRAVMSECGGFTDFLDFLEP